jgi:DNA-binding PadR family transcriptional regulator
MEPEPNLHAHLFVPILHDGGAMSIDELTGAVSGLPRKANLVIQWIKAAVEAGLVERAVESEERDHHGRELGPRFYRLTQAGQEQVEDFVRPALRDEEFLSRLEELGAGQTAETLSAQDSELAREYVTLWMESAYARGLVARSERGEPIKAELTQTGRQRLEGL